MQVATTVHTAHYFAHDFAHCSTPTLPTMLPPMLPQRLAQIAPFHVMEIVKQANALEQQGRDLIHMSIGEPDFTAPPSVVAAAQAAMQDGRLQYTAALGIAPLRAAIAQHYQEQFGVQIASERIVITAGASGALLLACAALVERDKEVLMPDPSYPCNRNFVAAFEGRAKLLPCGPEDRFQLNAAMLRAAWDEHSAGVLLASPSNPTGTSIAPTALQEILREVRQRNGFAIIDEIYQGLSYDAPPFTALSFAASAPELTENLVIINSFSKYFHMTGWRLGWMVVPAHLLPAIEKLAQNLYICPSSVAQYAALACFAEPAQTLYRQRKQQFQERRDYLLPELEKIGFHIPVQPDGAFYIYADCRALLDDELHNADQLCRAILHEAGVVIVQGLDFGPSTAEHYVRFSYATALPQLHEAIARLQRFVGHRAA